MKRLRPLGVASVVLGLVGWWAVTAAHLYSPQLLPSPGSVWHEFITVATNGYAGSSLWWNVVVSLRRLALGFGAAIIFGVIVGISMGANDVAKGLCDPIVEFYRPLPALSYLGLLIVWFGIGELSKIILLALASLPPIILSSANSVRSVRRERIEGARSLGLSGTSLYRYVIIPSCLPDILTGIRVGFGLAFAAIVAAEIVAASSGVGYMIWEASQYAVSTVVIVGIVTIGIIGVLIDGLIALLRARLVPWEGKG